MSEQAAEEKNINTTNLLYAKVVGIWLFLSGNFNRQHKVNHTIQSTPEQRQNAVVNDDNPDQVTIELGFPSSVQSSTSPPPPSPPPPPPSPETEPATTSSSSRSLLGSSSNYIPYFPFSNRLNSFDGESSVVSVDSEIMTQPSTSTSSPSSSSRSIFSGTTGRKNSNHHSYTMAKDSNGNGKKEEEEEESARAAFLNQELPKFMLGIAVTLLIGLMMLHFSHPEIYDMKKTKHLCLFIAIAFAALWIAIILGGLPLPYPLLIIRNIGHSLILGAFYGIIAIFLWHDPNLFIVPVVTFVVSVALDTFKFVKDFNSSP
ncbi:hypothetical protein CsatB_015612 [Cannabis sativa]